MHNPAPFHVAQLTGFSVGTVEAARSGSALVSQEVKERVARAVEALTAQPVMPPPTVMLPDGVDRPVRRKGIVTVAQVAAEVFNGGSRTRVGHVLGGRAEEHKISKLYQDEVWAVAERLGFRGGQ